MTIAAPSEVLDFWFGACPLDQAAMLRVHRQWFQKDDAFDDCLRHRFAPTLAEALAGRLDTWTADAPGSLALIIVLDQFTRNAFRGQAASFAGDLQARALALQALQRGFDQAVPALARPFFYLPLEHTEELPLQHRAVELFEALQQAAGGQAAEILAQSLDYGLRHRDVIQRYGRFPHRNAILARQSTTAELDYLAQPGAGF